MSLDETPQQPVSPTSGSVLPPMEPAIPMAPPTTWPVVIGIIAIVWATLSLLGGLCVLGGGFFSFFSWALSTNAPAFEISPVVIFGTGMGMVLKSCLLILGIGLLRRRFWAAHWFRAWAVADMLSFAVGAIVGHMMYQQQSTVLAHQPGMGQMPPGFHAGVAIFAVGCSLLLSWALPVFALIWFSRSRIKQEAATWQALRV